MSFQRHQSTETMNFQNKNTKTLRIFFLLLRKSWQVRRRHWITSLMEIFIPVSIIISFSWLSFDGTMSDSLIVKNEIHYESQSLEQLIDQIDNKSMIIMYTPSNAFTDKLINNVDQCLKNKAGEFTEIIRERTERYVYYFHYRF